MNNLLFQSLVPILTELPYQRSFQKFPERDAFFLTLALCRDAHAPFVIVDIGEAVFFHQADGVEVAGDGFPEVALALQIGFLDGAEGRSVLMEIDEGAFRSIDQRGDQLTVLVIVEIMCYLLYICMRL